jgi:membrane-bound serine protease (ClpP class)
MKTISLLTALVLSLFANAAHAQGTVVVLEVEGGIGVATADYVISGIEHAAETGAELIIIEMDTPGGLMGPMDDIVKAILGSTVPVATYVTPAGARAASAGTYILMASHIAAMAPTTRLGAATPVSLTGDNATPQDKGDKPADSESEGENASDEESAPSAPSGTDLERKVLNDALAEIRSLAERYGRNADWAEKAVRDAATLTASEALEQNVIEFVATTRADLLKQIDGYEVEINEEPVILATNGIVIEEYEPNWRIKILSAIANPEIVLLLGLIGVYGLMYEGWNPGAIVPGVVGVICLLLAAYALQVLPVNYAGLALIIVGLALMTAEAFAPSFGALGLGGIAAFVFGAIMMFDSGVPGFGISVAFVTGLAIIAALLIIWLVGFILKLRRRGAVSGRDSIVGGVGTALAEFTGEGKIWLEGEAWAARSTVPIAKDQQVRVIAMDGLVVVVEPLSQPTAGNTQLQT